MKSIQTIVINLLLFFYLTSSYLSATHIHNDALEQHGDCKICIVVKNLNSGDIPPAQLGNFDSNYSDEQIVLEQHQTTYQRLKGFNANAPPSFL